jgi:2-polyprenyl-3-methyl-5-hydroxy-6-metoxy-1,4-benzoquinol methylase
MERSITEIPPEVELEDEPCPLGCPRIDEVVLDGHDRCHDLPGEFIVVRCAACGLMRTNPRPTAETIGFYYPSDYGPYKSTRVNSGTSAERPAHRFSRFRLGLSRAIGFNTMPVPPLQPGKMLEVGCACGSFMFKMARKGWDVAGIEFSHDAAAARAAGLAVHEGALESIRELDADSLDLVVGWMVLEHLHQPVAALQSLRAWSKPDGWLVMSLPNAGAWEFKLFGNAWYPMHLPNHLFHYTADSVRKILDAGGWSLHSVHYQRTLKDLPRTVGFALDDAQRLPRTSKWLVQLSNSHRWKFAGYPLGAFLAAVGQSSRMTIWAQPNKM